MYPLKLVCEIIMQFFKQIWYFLRAIPDAIKHRGADGPAMRREAERLDRIRNPSKYLGK